jgi:hypothetical protein
MREKLTFANVVAAICLFVLLGGDSAARSAAGLITGGEIKNGTVSGRDVKNGSVGGRDVRDGTLGGSRLHGEQLPVGARGPAGPAGPKGDTGAPGAKGD